MRNVLYLPAKVSWKAVPSGGRKRRHFILKAIVLFSFERGDALSGLCSFFIIAWDSTELSQKGITYFRPDKISVHL